MKKIYLFAISTLIIINVNSQTTIKGAAADKKIHGAEIIRVTNDTKIPEYVQFRQGSEIDVDNFQAWLHSAFNLSASIGIKLLSTEKDKLGMVHYRYQQTINGIPVEGTMYIAHTKNNKVVSVNGIIFDKFNNTDAAPSLSEDAALQNALNYTHADEYRWQSAVHEAEIKEITDNTNATWFPKAELVFASPKGNRTAANYRLAYKFDIYADKPLKRNYVFVDAVSGKIIAEQNRILDINTPAAAYTVYSGHRNITTDSYSSGYRLEETARGLGCNLKTYNNQKQANATGTTDFNNATTTWNNINSNLDQYATDAHWGGEKTYDFYDSIFNRNSIDGNGYNLISFVHVDVSLVNAFWDGTEMNYGDGDSTQGYTPLTTLDVTGHEISHGLTQFTSALNGGAGTAEPGAINEGFSDCMGNSIRHYALNSTTVDWLIGDLIGGTPFRDMANPKSIQNPDTYLGQYWDAAQQEVHQNSTVFSHCYYLVAMGGSGTNDNSSVYNVTGLGIDKAEQIWFRANTVYFFPTTQYADARTYCIQAAVDLYGGCSPEVIAVTDAWYAVGVGAAFVPGATVCSFAANPTSYCALPANVSFVNTTTNGSNYTWDFGDGQFSSANNPVHTYTTAGSFTVKLSANSNCGIDSTTSTNYINISPPTSPVVTSPVNINCGTAATLSASGTALKWYTQPTGGTAIDTGTTYTTPVLNSSATYYVQTVITSPNVYSNPLDSALGAGSMLGYAHYEVFTVNQACTLLSVLVYAQGAGNRTITLNNSAGTVLNTVTINVPNGQSRVALNFPLAVGTNYQLAATGTPNLYRNSAGASYPYTDPAGLVTITTNDVPDPARFYYFYDWQLAPAPCTSALVPVVVNVNGGVSPTFNYNQSNNTFVFNNTTATSTSWLWTFGDGNSSASQNPTYTYAANGTYTVTLHATNGVCSDSITETVTVTTTGINSYSNTNALSVFPNPATDNLQISFNTTESGKEWTIKLNTVLAETLITKKITTVSGSNQLSLNLSELANGIYFLELQTNEEKIVRRIEKQ